MNLRLLLVVCAMLLLVSCGKKKTAAPATATTGESAPGAAAGDTANNPAATLAPLTQALRKYYFEHRQVPPTFEEFATAAGVQVPPAPPGKKFVIERKTLEVVLVDR